MNPTPTLGIIYDEPNEVYHKTMAWSKTKLDYFHRSPEWAYAKFIGKTEAFKGTGDSPAFRKGRAIHALILEGAQVFLSRFAFEPDFGPTRKTDNVSADDAKTNKTLRDEWRAANAGKEWLEQSEWDLAYRCALSAAGNRALTAIIAAGKPEVTFRAELTHFLVQARPDIFVEACDANLARLLCEHGMSVAEGDPLILDLKSTATLDEMEFGAFDKQFLNYGYFRSAPFYNSVVSEVLKREVKHFVFAAVETGEPYEIQLFTPTPDSIWTGYREVVSDLNELSQCYLSGVWPSRRDGKVKPLGIPEWYANKQLRKEKP